MYALFDDDGGMVENDFLSQAAAEEAIATRYSPDDCLHAGYECHDHPGHEADSCELCNLGKEPTT